MLSERDRPCLVVQRHIVDNCAVAVEYEPFAVGRRLPVHVRPSALAITDSIRSVRMGFSTYGCHTGERIATFGNGLLSYEYDGCIRLYFL